MGVVVDHPVTLVTIGDMKNPLILLACLAFVSMVVLEVLKVRGNIIIGILVFSIIAWATGLAKFNGVVSMPPSMTYLFDFDLGAAGRNLTGAFGALRAMLFEPGTGYEAKVFQRAHVFSVGVSLETRSRDSLTRLAQRASRRLCDVQE